MNKFVDSNEQLWKKNIKIEVSGYYIVLDLRWNLQ